MADGVEVGRAFVSIAGEVNAAQLARQGQEAASAFVKGFSGVASAGLSTIESRAGSAAKILGTIATSGTRAFSAISTAASTAQGAITSIHNGLSMIASGAGNVALALPRALGMASEAARSLSNEIGLSAFRLQMMGGVLSAFVTAPLLEAAKAIGTFGLETAMSLENAQVALSALLPPGYDVEALMKRLQAFAIASPIFAIDDITNFTKRLVGAQIPIEQTEQLLDALNKIMITFGVTGQGASDVLLGVQQVFQKGVVQSEELTRQISQQLPIWGLLSQASGLTQAQLLDLSKSGEFTSQMFADMLIQIGQLPSIMQGAAGGVKTLSAQWSIMKEAFQQTIATRLLEFFPQIKESIAKLQPTIDQFTSFIVSQIPTVIDLLGKLVDKFLELRQQFDDLPPSTRALLLEIAEFAPIVGPALLVVGTLASSLSALLGVVAFAINPITVFFAAVSYGLYQLYKTSEDFRSGMDAFKNSFLNDFQEEMPNAMRGFNAAVTNDLLPALVDLAKAFGFTTWQDFGSWLGNTLPKLMMAVISSAVRTINLLTVAVTYLRDQWVLLDDVTQKNILHFTALGFAIVPLLPLLAAVLGGVSKVASILAFLTSPVGLVLVAVGALAYEFKRLWDTSEQFRTTITTFSAAFQRSWAKEIPSALAAFKAAVVSDLLPALKELAIAFGFTGWTTFAEALGTILPKIIAHFVKTLTLAVHLISDALRWVAKEWSSLSGETQKAILKMAGFALLLLPILPVVLAVGSALFGITGALIGLAGAIAGSVLGLLRGLLGVFGSLLGVLLNFHTLLAVGLVAGLAAAAYGMYTLWQTSEQFRGIILSFVAGFESAWGQRMPAAIAALESSLTTKLLPAILRLASAFGINTWEQFSFFLGTLLPRALSLAVEVLTKVINIVSRVLDFFTEKWTALDGVTQENIKTMGKWAASTAAVIIAAEAVAAVILKVLGPWELLTVGVVAGIKYLWDSSATFREGILAFADAFSQSWNTNVIPALKALWQSVTGNLIPALLGLAHAFGLPEFKTFQEFMGWFGTVLPGLIAAGVAKIEQAIGLVSQIVRDVTDKWNSLSDAQKESIKSMAEWGVAAAAFVLVAKSVGGAILGMFGPWGLLLVGAVALFKYFWDTSAPFREGILAFGKAFEQSWKANVIPALKAFGDSIKTNLLPALRDMLHAFGLPEFGTFKDFMTWFGNELPILLANGIKKFKEVADDIAAAIRKVTEKWNELDDAQQKTILHMAGFALAASPFAGSILGVAKSLGGLLLSNPGLAILGLALVAVGYGIKYLWDNSQDFRDGIHAFQDSFKRTWGEEGPAAIRRLKDAFKNDLVPAFKELAASVGFSTFKEFGEWLGDKFAHGAAVGIDILTEAVHKLADGFRTLADNMPAIKQHISEFADKIGELKDKWDNLTDGQQKALLGLAGAGAVGIFGNGAPADLIKSGVGGALGAIAALGPAGLLAGAGLALVAGGFVSAYKENDTFKGKVDDMAKGFKSSFETDVLPKLKDLWKTIKEDLVPAILDFLVALGGGDPETAGRNLARGLGYAVDAVKGLAEGVTFLLNGLTSLWTEMRKGSAGAYKDLMNLYNNFIDINNAVGHLLTGGVVVPKIDQKSIDYMMRVEEGQTVDEAIVNTWYRDDPNYQSMVDFFRKNNEHQSRLPFAHAAGGLITGPGTGISDSILARLSNGEFVMKAAAVDHWGLGTLSAMNNMSSVSPARQTNDSAIPADRPVNLYATVMLGNEVLVNKMQAVVDTNNAAAIRLMRNGRGLRNGS